VYNYNGGLYDDYPTPLLSAQSEEAIQLLLSSTSTTSGIGPEVHPLLQAGIKTWKVGDSAVTFQDFDDGKYFRREESPLISSRALSYLQPLLLKTPIRTCNVYL
jgi:hypothetical protein